MRGYAVHLRVWFSDAVDVLNTIQGRFGRRNCMRFEQIHHRSHLILSHRPLKPIANKDGSIPYVHIHPIVCLLRVLALT